MKLPRWPGRTMVCRAVALFNLAALAAFVMLPAASARPADCTLVVKGRTYIKGPCEFKAEKDGSFQISGGDYFAYVNVTGDVAEASWNADPKSTHAQAPLGTLQRKGACWSNAIATICARALPPAQAKAIQAAQPAGEMIYPDFPGASQSCIGIEGRLQTGATPVLHNCKLPADRIFVRNAEGRLSIDKNPRLCIDLESPGMMRPPQLVLNECRQSSRTWTWQGRGTDSGVVRSSDGLCWRIPALADPNAQFPFAITAMPCSRTAGENLRFFVTRE